MSHLSLFMVMLMVMFMVMFMVLALFMVMLMVMLITVPALEERNLLSSVKVKVASTVCSLNGSLKSNQS